MTKKELRDTYLNRRMELPESEFAALENRVITRLLELPAFRESRSVHCYLPIRKKREINTWQVIQRLWADKKVVSVPALSRDMPVMDCLELDSEDQLELAQWGIEEPLVKRKTHPENIDASIVPLLCFDEKGYRVGYGKGYYDRFFKVAPQCLKIGVSLFGPEPVIEGITAQDVPLDVCVSPDKVYLF